MNAPPVPPISRCIHIVYRHKNVWEYQRSNFIYNCQSTFLHYVRCKYALLDCSAPGGERCLSLTWVDEIALYSHHMASDYFRRLSEQNVSIVWCTTWPLENMCSAVSDFPYICSEVCISIKRYTSLYVDYVTAFQSLYTSIMHVDCSNASIHDTICLCQTTNE